MIEGLSHMTFVSSGDRTFSVSREKFFVAGDVWIAVMEGESLPTRSYNHVAFKVADEEIEPCLERIRSLGLEVKPPRPRVEGEGRSIYFHDEDNHLFEIHSGTLEQRLAAYERMNTEAAE